MKTIFVIQKVQDTVIHLEVKTCVLRGVYVIYGQSIDQPGEVANPARGQLDMENENFPVPVYA